MKVRFADEAARAAGMPEHTLALQTSLTVKEVLVILGNLYPGLTVLYSGRRSGWPHAYLNGNPVGPDTPVTDADLLEIVPTDAVY